VARDDRRPRQVTITAPLLALIGLVLASSLSYLALDGATIGAALGLVPTNPPVAAPVDLYFPDPLRLPTALDPAAPPIFQFSLHNATGVDARYTYLVALVDGGAADRLDQGSAVVPAGATRTVSERLTVRPPGGRAEVVVRLLPAGPSIDFWVALAPARD
jgi:hypothetical protein